MIEEDNPEVASSDHTKILPQHTHGGDMSDSTLDGDTFNNTGSSNTSKTLNHGATNSAATTSNTSTTTRRRSENQLHPTLTWDSNSGARRLSWTTSGRSARESMDGSDRIPTLSSSINDRSNREEDERGSHHSDEGGSVGCLTATCDPKRSYYRFVGLFFMCFLGFGSYFCYDTPGSMQNQIKEDMNVNTLQFTSLYSLYSWPNVVLCFVGGFLIDKVFGIRMGTLIFSIIVTVGQFVYAFGAVIDAFWVMQFGRFIFGVGGESLAVAQNAYAVSWFKGKELNTVFGLQLSMARVGSTVNFLVMESVYDWVDGTEDGHTTLGISLFIAGSTCVFSLLCAMVMAGLDRRRERVLHEPGAEVGEKIRLKDITFFPPSFWLISVICVAYYSAIFPFIGLSKVFFMYKYDMNDTQANSVSSIVYIISAVASPFFGMIVDRTGRNIMWVGMAVVVTLLSHTILAFSFINPYIAMSLMGVSYSLLASSLWPMVALILPESQIGTAYGIMQSIQNLGLALIIMLSGFIVDNYGFLMLEVLNLICLSVALGATGVIWFVDAIQNDGYLMRDTRKRPAVSAVAQYLEERAKANNKPESGTQAPGTEKHPAMGAGTDKCQAMGSNTEQNNHVEVAMKKCPAIETKTEEHQTEAIGFVKASGKEERRMDNGTENTLERERDNIGYRKASDKSKISFIGKIENHEMDIKFDESKKIEQIDHVDATTKVVHSKINQGFLDSEKSTDTNNRWDNISKGENENHKQETNQSKKDIETTNQSRPHTEDETSTEDGRVIVNEGDQEEVEEMRL